MSAQGNAQQARYTLLITARAAYISGLTSSALNRGERESLLHLSSHTGYCRCCQDIPWQILEAGRVAYMSQKMQSPSAYNLSIHY